MKYWINPLGTITNKIEKYFDLLENIPQNSNTHSIFFRNVSETGAIQAMQLSFRTQIYFE